MGDGPSSSYAPGYACGGLTVVWYCHREAPSLLPANGCTRQSSIHAYVLPVSVQWGEIRVTRRPHLPVTSKDEQP